MSHAISVLSRAIFLDRDGVINRKAPEPRYITCWEAFEFLPGVLAALARLAATDLVIAVVSNQRAVARGLLSRRGLDQLHARMLEEIRRAGGRVDGIYCCTHDNDAGCACRKPRPGLLQQAAREYQLDLAASWIIGDRQSDVEAGRTVGCTTVRVAAPDAEDLDPWTLVADYKVTDLAAAVDLILGFLREDQGKCGQ